MASKNAWSKRVVVMSLIAACAMGAISVIAWLYYKKPQATTDTAAQHVVTRSVETPSEKRPDAAYRWNGAPDAPKRITMPSVKIDGFVQAVGVDQHNEIAVPNNIYVAGWFTESAKPGEKGLSIIDGHVNGRKLDGIFKNLVQIKKGNTFSIERGDGKKIRYLVTATTSVSYDASHEALFSQDSKVPSQLNLVTCDGKYDEALGTYDKRLIVSAVPQ